MPRTAVVAGGSVLSYGQPAQAVERSAAKTGLPQVKPEDIGIDPKRLQVAYDRMEKWTTGSTWLVNLREESEWDVLSTGEGTTTVLSSCYD